MSSIPQAILDGLFAEAQAAAKLAYAPYSNFSVGCAILTADNTIITGVNVENAAYPQSQCAEASAIGAMVSQGYTDIKAIAVYSPNCSHPCWPCGACRQRLIEFSDPSTPIYSLDSAGKAKEYTIGELLPARFDKSSLA